MSCTMLNTVMNMKLRIRDLREDSDKTQKEIAAFLLCALAADKLAKNEGLIDADAMPKIIISERGIN